MSDKGAANVSAETRKNPAQETAGVKGSWNAPGKEGVEPEGTFDSFKPECRYAEEHAQASQAKGWLYEKNNTDQGPKKDEDYDDYTGTYVKEGKVRTSQVVTTEGK